MTRPSPIISLAEQAAAKVDARVQAKAPPPRPKMIDAAVIMSRQLAPVRYVIPGWLSEGLLLLVANPKVGKSTLILQLAQALASGGEFWGETVPAAHALIIDLETNERRLRRKLGAAGAGTIPPGAMHFAFEWPRGIVGVDEIAQALDSDPEIRLVVIDTLQRFRESSSGGKNAYAADYETLMPLQQLCKERPGLAIVVVHHRRKAKHGDDDPIDSINGSAALAGAADGIWILGRKGPEFTLTVQARDWERDEDEFLLVRDSGRWELSNAPRYTFSETEILSLLDKVGPMSTKALAEGLAISRQAALGRLQRMQSLGHVHFREDAWHGVR
ncbi:MAG: AAA family ATPase [Caldimonas sp.]